VRDTEPIMFCHTGESGNLFSHLAMNVHTMFPINDKNWIKNQSPAFGDQQGLLVLK